VLDGLFETAVEDEILFVSIGNDFNLADDNVRALV
jgi:hypothetical protein